MNAFHPALTGVLYGVLAQHEQAFAQMALAANHAQLDVYDDETVERYAAIISGLKRMIKAAEPSGYDASTIEVTEEMRRRHAVLGDLLSRLTDFKVGSCSISPHYGHGIQINMPFTHKSLELDPRGAMREIARRFDLQYGERRHGKTGTTLHIDATGQIQGIDVEIYELIQAERPFCDLHNVMIDGAGVCPECPGLDRDEDLLAELRLVHAVEQHGDDRVCGFCSERQEAPVLWPCSDLRTAEVELGGADDEADDGTHEGRYTDAQLDGTACSECGGDFAEGAATVPAGLVIDGGQLFAHPDCLTDNTTTEPPGDAP